MTNDLNNLEVLVRVANDFEATGILAALKERNIEANAIGGFTAGFVAEAPGQVEIVVRKVDLERAQAALADEQIADSKIDWSKVDVGEPEEE